MNPAQDLAPSHGRSSEAELAGAIANGPAIEDGLPPAQRARAFLALAIAVCLATLDTAITNTALPSIAADIGADPATSIWIVNAYQLTVIAALLPLASLGEVWGHRQVYIVGLVLFTVTSLACGYAWSLPSLVAARALQGLGAAAIMSVNTALIRFIYPSRMLGRGVGLNALMVGIAFTIGPTVASCILAVASWHWLFLINVPAGIVAAALSLRTLPHTRPSGHRFDPLAALLCCGFFALLILALGQEAHGAAPLVVVSELAGAVICFGLLWLRQAHHPAPMLAVDLFRAPVFALSAATAVCSFAAQGLTFVSLPFLLQKVLGHSEVETGFLITPWPAVVAILAPIAGRLSDRYPPAILGGIGLAVLSLGLCSLGLLPDRPTTFDLAWRMMLCGAGFGLFQSPNLRALMTSAPPGRSGGASGIVATARLLGQTSGAALVAFCFHLWGAHGPWLALWLGCAFSAAGSLASFLRLLPRRVR